MDKQEKDLVKTAKKLWEQRDLSALEKLRGQPGAARNADVLYFVGLAMNACNKRREAIECWRKARDLDPHHENATRTLAYELMKQAPVDAAELLCHLVGSRRPLPTITLASAKSASNKTGLAKRDAGSNRRYNWNPTTVSPCWPWRLSTLRCADPSFTLDYLEKTNAAEDVDLSGLASAPEFEFLWHHPKFEKIVASNGCT